MTDQVIDTLKWIAQKDRENAMFKRSQHLMELAGVGGDDEIVAPITWTEIIRDGVILGFAFYGLAVATYQFTGWLYEKLFWTQGVPF